MKGSGLQRNGYDCGVYVAYWMRHHPWGIDEPLEDGQKFRKDMLALINSKSWNDAFIGTCYLSISGIYFWFFQHIGTGIDLVVWIISLTGYNSCVELVHTLPVVKKLAVCTY